MREINGIRCGKDYLSFLQLIIISNIYAAEQT